MNIEDEVAIHQLMSLYGHFMDQAQSAAYLAIGRPVDFSEVFLDNVHFRFGDQELNGRAGIEAMLDYGGDGEEVAVAHCVTNVYVYEADGQTRVHAKWFVPDRATGGLATGDYHNVVERTSAGWRIASVDARVRSFPGGAPQLKT
jgi:hypothetical protein